MKPLLIVISPYYRDIGVMLERGARSVIDAAGYPCETITVPGAFEIPAAIAVAHASGRYAGYVALGCIIRGDTSHYDIVCNESARGLMDLAVRESVAIGLGILTCETMEQAVLRADPTQGNKGGEAASAAMAIVDLKQRMAGAA